MIYKLVGALCAVVLALPLHAETLTADRIRVIDGDTIKVDGKAPNYRLVGFNAPETPRAQCTKERTLGIRPRAGCAT